MKVYAVYEQKEKRDACLGVFDTMEALCRGMRISKMAGWSNLYRAASGKRRCQRSNFIIVRLSIPRHFTEERRRTPRSTP